MILIMKTSIIIGNEVLPYIEHRTLEDLLQWKEIVMLFSLLIEDDETILSKNDFFNRKTFLKFIKALKSKQEW